MRTRAAHRHCRRARDGRAPGPVLCRAQAVPQRGLLLGPDLQGYEAAACAHVSDGPPPARRPTAASSPSGGDGAARSVQRWASRPTFSRSSSPSRAWPDGSPTGTSRFRTRRTRSGDRARCVPLPVGLAAPRQVGAPRGLTAPVGEGPPWGVAVTGGGADLRRAGEALVHSGRPPCALDPAAHRAHHLVLFQALAYRDLQREERR